MVSLRTVGVSQASDGVVRSVGSLSIRACSNRREVTMLHPYYVAWWILGAYFRVAQLVQFSSREPCPATTSCGTRDSSFTPTLSPKGALKLPAPYSGCNSLRLACCMLHEAPAAVATQAQLRTMPPTTSATSRRRAPRHPPCSDGGAQSKKMLPP